MNVRHEVRRYIVENILFGDGDKLDDHASFQESGIVDSTGFLELIAFIEETFDMTLTDEELVPENFDSVARIAKFVETKPDQLVN
jgi:acyl carrier protein